jgi:hypothetical protein
MPSRATLMRYLRASIAGTLPALPTPKILPAEKSAFPKVLALDCNKWIALGRAHYNVGEIDPAAQPALDAIRTATGSGRLVVPLHFMNAVEAAKGQNPERRERLASFMVNLAENHCFRPFPLIEAAERRAAVMTTYLGRAAEPIRPSVVGYGLDGLMGRPASPEALEAFAALRAAGGMEAMEAWRASPETTVEAIIDRMRRDGMLERDREREARGAEVIQATRDATKGLTEAQRARLELQDMWDHPSSEPVRDALREFGEDLDAFSRWLGRGENLLLFWRAVPGLHVTLALENRAGRSRQRKVVPNDFRDLSFYKCAVPYSNVVVMEKHWANVIGQTKLDQMYGTRVLSDLGELPATLVDAGCL